VCLKKHHFSTAIVQKNTPLVIHARLVVHTHGSSTMRVSSRSDLLCIVSFSGASFASTSSFGSFGVSNKPRANISAFVPTSTSPSFPRQHQTRTKSSGANSPGSTLNALIFYPDDSNNNYMYEDTSTQEYYNDNNNDNNIFQTIQSTAAASYLASLAEKLSQDPSKIPLLALLASAFSPTGYDIDLGHINHVRCLAVDNRHLEIEAVVCDETECSSLLVPVDFVQECDISNMDDFSGLEECVLGNVISLSGHGEELIKAREVEHTFEDKVGAVRALEVLQSVDDFCEKSSSSSNSSNNMPEWWIYPRLSEEADECDMIRNLMNEQDMQDVVQALASYALKKTDVRFRWKWEHVISSTYVRAIGPAGMVLSVEAGDGVAMDLPISFGSGTGEFKDSIRSIRGEVLDMMAVINV